MARTRSIKPGFFDNEILGELPALTRLLFIGLWCLSDRDGRLQDRPKRIKKELLGYDDVTTEDVDGMLQQLHDHDFILRYTVADVRYIQVINFSKHQNPHIKEKESEIPPPIEKSTASGAAGTGSRPDTPSMTSDKLGVTPDQHDAGTELSGPLMDNLIPSTGTSSLISATEVSERFAEFWAAYPKKKSKGEALATWKKLKPNGQLCRRIMAGLEKAKMSKEWNKESGQFIPYPAKWLKAQGWEDEYEEATPNESATEIGTALSGFQKA